jgi:hypothetical protein
LLALAIVPAAFLSAPLVPAYALQRAPVQRVIQGKVENKAGAAIKGAIVYLKDDRSSSVKSAITSEDGSYRFGQLSLSTDYELWAAINGKKSATKSISSFDDKPQFTITLKIDE